jgi:hypothetical protein
MYVLVQDDALGMTAVASFGERGERATTQAGIRAITFVWDRQSGKMKLTLNSPLGSDEGAVVGSCVESTP